MIQFLIDNFNLTTEEANAFSVSFYEKDLLKGDVFIPYGKHVIVSALLKKGF